MFYKVTYIRRSQMKAAGGVRRGGEREEVEKTLQRAAEDLTLMLLLQLARRQHNEPVTQPKQTPRPSLNKGSTVAAFLTCKHRPVGGSQHLLKPTFCFPLQGIASPARPSAEMRRAPPKNWNYARRPQTKRSRDWFAKPHRFWLWAR